MKRTLRITYELARRIVVTVVGVSVVLVGLALLVLPGPALVVIPIGLAILGMEFAFARRWLRVLREQGEAAFARFIIGTKDDDSQDSRPSDPAGGAS